MKKSFWILPTAMAALGLALVVAGCTVVDSELPEFSPFTNGNIGTNLKITNVTVYTETITDNEVTHKALDSNLGDLKGFHEAGTAQVVQGKLSVDLTTPADPTFDSALTSDTAVASILDATYYENGRANVKNAKYAMLALARSSGTPANVKKEETTIVPGAGTAVVSKTVESVSYVYFSKAVTVTATGKIVDGYQVPDVELVYKAGWNAVYMEKVTDKDGKVTKLEMKVSDHKNLKWVNK
jgi:hypothetical protein